MNPRNGRKDTSVPLTRLISGKRVNDEIYPETARPHGLRVYVYRECPSNREHGWLPKQLVETWQGSDPVTITTKVVFHVGQQHAKVFPPRRLTLEDLLPLLALRPAPEEQSCKKAKSIRF